MVGSNYNIGGYMFFLFLLSCFFLRGMPPKDIYEIEKSFVEVYSGQNGGSGNIINYKDNSYLITAAHNVDEKSDVIILKDLKLTKYNIYFDKERDTAIFKVPFYIDSLKYKTAKKPKIGQRLHYWCSPALEGKKYFQAIVSEVRNDYIVLNGYGWFGCSGAVIFDDKNSTVGIIVALMATENPDPFSVSDYVHENIVYVYLLKENHFGE